MDRICSTHEKTRNAYRILVGKPERKRSLEKARRGWKDNIKMNLRELGWVGMYWIDVTQDKDCCEHGNEPSGSIKFWEIL
jgi:hypothetical protein